MFQEDVQKRLELLDSGAIDVSSMQMHLTEKTDAGYADLQLELYSPCILFRNLEKKKLQYFKNQKCSDYVMFEYTKEQWFLHIFELKRSIGKNEWIQVKKQFMGALQNALALAGVLNIKIKLEHVYVYTVFRNDKFKNMANTAKERLKMYERDKKYCEDYDDWNGKTIRINFLGENEFVHQKVKLDIESGKGCFPIRTFFYFDKKLKDHEL